MCSLWIISAWQAWEENPAFIGVGQAPVRAWEIPFPAVTVCPIYRYNQYSEYRFPNIEGESTTNESVVLEPSDKCDYFKNNDKYGDTDFFEGEPWEKFLTETALSPNQVILKSFLTDGNDTTDISFSSIQTQWGVCHTFNSLDKADLFRDLTHTPESFWKQRTISYWTFDKNYYKKNEAVYPQRLKNMIDNVVVHLESTLGYVACFTPNEYYISLHHPGESPTLGHTITIKPEKDYNIWIKPEITIASERLKPYSPSRKKCFFSDERYLQFYKIYTEDNCKLECLANYTLTVCGCVPAYFPHNKTTKLCGRNRSGCLQKSERVMAHLESGLTQDPVCNCLPSCNSVIYTWEVDSKESEYQHRIVVTLQYKNVKFNVLERNELFGDVNFWSSCGGILGLFAGFSVLSLAEIFYYLVFRWMNNLFGNLWEKLHRLYLSF
ncbi:pickpocket protein 28-like [Zophobas morio]